MNEHQLKALADKIPCMGYVEIIELKRKISLSNIKETDPKAAFYLLQAIEVREVELRKREKAMAVEGEVKRGEMG